MLKTCSDNDRVYRRMVKKKEIIKEVIMRHTSWMGMEAANTTKEAINKITVVAFMMDKENSGFDVV